MSNNNFLAHDLSVFSQFVNLESLSIRDNRFYGSLKPLQGLKKLRELYIWDLSSLHDDLEYLPKNLVEIYVNKNNKIQVRLENFQISNKTDYYNYQGWRKANKAFFRQNSTIRTTINSATSKS